jgi:hypothetical protein
MREGDIKHPIAKIRNSLSIVSHMILTFQDCGAMSHHEYMRIQNALSWGRQNLEDKLREVKIIEKGE